MKFLSVTHWMRYERTHLNDVIPTVFDAILFTQYNTWWLVGFVFVLTKCAFVITTTIANQMQRSHHRQIDLFTAFQFTYHLLCSEAYKKCDGKRVVIQSNRFIYLNHVYLYVRLFNWAQWRDRQREKKNTIQKTKTFAFRKHCSWRTYSLLRIWYSERFINQSFDMLLYSMCWLKIDLMTTMVSFYHTNTHSALHSHWLRYFYNVTNFIGWSNEGNEFIIWSI